MAEGEGKATKEDNTAVETQHEISCQPVGYNFALVLTVGLNCLCTVCTFTLLTILALYLYMHANMPSK